MARLRLRELYNNDMEIRSNLDARDSDFANLHHHVYLINRVQLLDQPVQLVPMRSTAGNDEISLDWSVVHQNHTINSRIR